MRIDDDAAGAAGLVDDRARQGANPLRPELQRSAHEALGEGDGERDDRLDAATQPALLFGAQGQPLHRQVRAGLLTRLARGGQRDDRRFGARLGDDLVGARACGAEELVRCEVGFDLDPGDAAEPSDAV